MLRTKLSTYVCLFVTCPLAAGATCAVAGSSCVHEPDQTSLLQVHKNVRRGVEQPEEHITKSSLARELDTFHKLEDQMRRELEKPNKAVEKAVEDTDELAEASRHATSVADKALEATDEFEEANRHATRVAKKALDDVDGFAKDYQHTTKSEADVLANISKAEEQERVANLHFHSQRASAVRFARRKALANETLTRVQKALQDAISGEAEATHWATKEKQNAKQAAEDTVRFKKLLIETQTNKKRQLHKWRDGKTAAQTAYANQLLAERAATQHKAVTSAKEKSAHQIDAWTAGHEGEVTEVKKAMENAYMASTPGSKISDIPSWGLGS